MKLNRTIFFPNINKLCNFLSDKNHVYQDYNFLYNKKIALMHYNIKNYSIINIWKAHSFFNFWYTDYMESDKTDHIASFSYHLNNDSVKIDYMNINNNYNDKQSTCGELSSNLHFSAEINQSIMLYFKEYALKNNKYLIKANVHKNLRTYYKYYHHQGFELTDKICMNNQFLIKIEKKLI